MPELVPQYYDEATWCQNYQPPAESSMSSYPTGSSSEPSFDWSLHNTQVELGSRVQQVKNDLDLIHGTPTGEKIMQYAQAISEVVSRIKIPGVVPKVEIDGGDLTLRWRKVKNA